MKNETVEEKKKVEEEIVPAPQLTSGIEAQTQGMNYLLPQKPKNKDAVPEYSKLQAYPKLEHGAIVLVMNIEGDYAKVRTLIQTEGWVPKENLHPLNNADSNRYFEKRRFGEISTVLGVYEAPFIKLFNDMNTRERVEGKCFKNDKVVILDETEEYVKVGNINGKEGWCMKGFVKFL